MFELLVLILFGWMFFGALRVVCRVTWGLAKFAAVILMALALPALLVCLLFCGRCGFALAGWAGRPCLGRGEGVGLTPLRRPWFIWIAETGLSFRKTRLWGDGILRAWQAAA